MAKNEELFDEIKQHANDIKSDYSKRNDEFEDYEDMYNMQGTESQRGNETVMVTTSPTAHNKVAGAVRLLQSQDIRFDIHSKTATKIECERIETLLSDWWKAMFSINGKPLINEIILAAALYSDVHIGMTLLEDYKKYNPTDPRIKRLERKTPVLFEVWNPRFGYPERDALGLSAYYQELEVPFSYIKNTYGNLVEEADKKDTTKVTLKRFWDLENYAVWYDEELLDCGPHGLPCIPVSVTATQGSDLFEDMEDRYQPLLFALKRSSLWERENMSLTTLYTTAAAIAFTPSFKWKTDSNEDLRVEISDGVQYYRMNKGDDVEPITNKGVFTREIGDIIQLTTNLIDNSTVYDAAFGNGNGGNGTSSFSESTLLAQSARLPLVPIMHNVGMAVGDIMQISLDIMHTKGTTLYFGDNTEIKCKDLPEDLIVDAKLDVILPQERTQLAATAATINANGLASKEWVRSEVMGIPHNEKMEQEIAQETVSKALVEYYTQKMVNDLAMQDQMRQQQQQQQMASQEQLNQQAVQADMAGYDMGGAQNIPIGTEQTNPALQQIQNQAMMNNIAGGTEPQVPEGMQSPTAGIAGGMPSEMMGMIPQGGM